MSSQLYESICERIDAGRFDVMDARDTPGGNKELYDLIWDAFLAAALPIEEALQLQQRMEDRRARSIAPG